MKIMNRNVLLSWIDKLLPSTVGEIPPISRAICKTGNSKR
jgi:hypothetical protein